MLFICYPKCTTCRRAGKWLEDNNIDFVQRDIKEENPTYSELKRWHTLSGLPVRRFINTSGLTYKSMGLKEKLGTMTDDDILELLSRDGMLVKRPIVVTGDTVLVGFDEAVWPAALI